MARAGVAKEPYVIILRIGHRIPRDIRVTTHVCLTARALGAKGIIISDVSDKRLVETVNQVTADFGGDFTIETGTPWHKVIIDWKRKGGKVVHLTAYGLPLNRVIEKIRRSSPQILVIIGAEKMPGVVFRLADWNVAISNQPMSEVSALGIFLDWFFDHGRMEYVFPNARIRMVPTEHGKRVITKD